MTALAPAVKISVSEPLQEFDKGNFIFAGHVSLRSARGENQENIEDAKEEGRADHVARRGHSAPDASLAVDVCDSVPKDGGVQHFGALAVHPVAVDLQVCAGT